MSILTEQQARDIYLEWAKTPGAGSWDIYSRIEAALLRQLTATQEAPEWQPIETAPKDGTAILLGHKHGTWIGKYLPVYQSGYVPDNKWASLMLNHDHMGEKWTKPTHWMPLPPLGAAEGVLPGAQGGVE